MGKYYTRPVCFKYSKVWFNNRICRSTSLPACTPFNFSRLETEVIDAEISKHPSKGVIVTTTTEPNDYV